jgi:DNA polymerase V
MSYYKKDVIDIVHEILGRIQSELKIPAACGIGQNMVMAKLALDIDAKKAPNFIAEWTYDDLPERLWKVSPLSEMWGIGKRLEKSLNELGYFKIGDIATANIDVLRKHFGVIGEELYYHTNGIDLSDITNRTPMSGAKSYGLGQTLFQDYFQDGIMVIMREMVDDVATRMRLAERAGRTVHLSIGYSKSTSGGFGRQMKLDFPTNDPDVIYKACKTLFDKFYESSPIRRISISISHLEVDDHYIQMSLFDDPVEVVKRRALLMAMDEIKKVYGKNSVLRATSKMKSSTVRHRNELIGGHNAF